MTTLQIGLTGNIGSGKSTVAELLVERGAALVDADALAREATRDPEVLREIAKKLGDDLVQDGQLKRAKTAERVFGDEAARQTLNSIVHPWVRRESDRRVTEVSGQDPPPKVIVLDIPLLYENGLEQGLAAVVVVDAPLELRVKRVAKRSGLTGDEVRARDAAQMPLATKVARADFVVDNAGSQEEVERQVVDLWSQLLALPSVLGSGKS